MSLISSLPGKNLRTLVDTARLAEIKRILGDCLLISSLPGKALRTFFDIAWPSDSTCVLKAEPVKLDIKRHSRGISIISLHSV